MRQFWGTKVAAIGFICQILLGNLWLVWSVLGQTIPGWLWDAIILAAAIVITGGIAMAVKSVQISFNSEDQ